MHFPVAKRNSWKASGKLALSRFYCLENVKHMANENVVIVKLVTQINLMKSFLSQASFVQLFRNSSQL